MKERTTMDIGEGIGGVSGAVAGAAIGTLGGPLGSVIGAIAGAVGGWWTGRALGATSYDAEDEEAYRRHYESSSPAAGRAFELVRPAYQLGHLAAQNPEYRGQPFSAVEPQLERGWNAAAPVRHGAWRDVRGHAQEAFTRESARAGRAPDREAPPARGELVDEPSSAPVITRDDELRARERHDVLEGEDRAG